MRIGICDDEDIFLENFKNRISAHLSAKDIQSDIILFHSGEELLSYNQQIDILFLDYEMGTLNGFDVATELRRRKDDIAIVFVTSHDEVMQKAFYVNAFRFIRKTDHEYLFLEAIDSFFQNEMNVSQVCISSKGKEFYVKVTDIAYITATHNGSELWLKHDSFTNDHSLSDWMEILDSNMFFRAHRNNIVNLAHIRQIEHVICLFSGEKLQLSRRKVSELNKAYRQYIYDHAR